MGAGTKVLKGLRNRGLEAHHALPIGKSLDTLDWHLRHLGDEEALSTIVEIPKEVHRAMKGKGSIMRDLKDIAKKKLTEETGAISLKWDEDWFAKAGRQVEKLPLNLGKRLKTLLNMPISRREFIEGAAKEGSMVVGNKPGNLAEMAKQAVSGHPLDNVYFREELGNMLLTLGSHSGKRGKLIYGPGKEISTGKYHDAVEAFFDPGLSDIIEMPYKEFKKYYGGWLNKFMDKGAIEKVYALVKTGKLEEASELTILNYFKNKNIPELTVKKSVQDYIDYMAKWKADYTPLGEGGMPEEWIFHGNDSPKEYIQAMKKALDDLGISWDKAGRLKIAEGRMTGLEEMGDKAIEMMKKVGGKIAGETAKAAGETEVTRRQFLGLGWKDTLKNERGSISFAPIDVRKANQPISETERTIAQKFGVSIEDARKIIESDYSKKGINLLGKVSPAEREQILENLATSHKRRWLIDTTKQPLEEYLNWLPPGSRAYVMGSMASGKASPRDLDIYASLPPKGWEKYWDTRPPFGEWRERVLGHGSKTRIPAALHITDFPAGQSPARGSVTSLPWNPEKMEEEFRRDTMLSNFLKTGKRKYGKDYNWIKILSMMGVPVGAGLSGEAQAEGTEQYPAVQDMWQLMAGNASPYPGKGFVGRGPGIGYGLGGYVPGEEGLSNLQVNPEYRGKAVENPPGVREKDYSTEWTTTIQYGDKFYVIPTIIGGEQKTPVEAFDLFLQNKIPSVAVADTQEEADMLATERSEMLETEQRR